MHSPVLRLWRPEEATIHNTSLSPCAFLAKYKPLAVFGVSEDPHTASVQGAGHSQMQETKEGNSLALSGSLGIPRGESTCNPKRVLYRCTVSCPTSDYLARTLVASAHTNYSGCGPSLLTTMSPGTCNLTKHLGLCRFGMIVGTGHCS